MNPENDSNYVADEHLQEPTSLTGSLAQTWVEVNAGALRQNIAALTQHLQTGVQSEPILMVVVKANAYGHGLAEAAQVFSSANVVWYGVTSLQEAAQLVQTGIGRRGERILVFSPLVTADPACRAAECSVRFTICDETHLRLVASAAKITGRTCFVHLKVNTGMSRLGLDPKAALAVASEAGKCDGVVLEGVYTHFSQSPDRQALTTLRQAAQFNEFCAQVAAATGRSVIRHAANSAAAIRFPQTRMDMVRLGTLVYGQYPSKHVPRVSGLQAETMQVKARVVFVRELNAGVVVGYGSQTRLRRNTRAAVVPVGFADGFSMNPSSLTSGLRGLKSIIGAIGSARRDHVLIGGYCAPVLGRIAMQMTVVDVTDAPKPVEVGDVATVPMRRLSVNACLPRVVIDKESSS